MNAAWKTAGDPPPVIARADSAALAAASNPPPPAAESPQIRGLPGPIRKGAIVS